VLGLESICLLAGAKPTIVDGEALASQEIFGFEAIGADMFVRHHPVEHGSAG
jgi:hypothetical protein